ncbi:SDR family NAD(P)-dependent oxidoreductase [Promicromonospora panici]|uniref:SDR family NAD(P)-dependent oxidoreductase n=1 Tax=Promicromonospora panici TaxID=2219658 RepID=UPI00101D158D|nr:SDR family NAD(P)-dependent oxidoreductase [Promicromonospora panici]
MSAARVWMVTGASSGFGEAIARAALDGGDTVVGTSRSADRLRGLADAYGDRFVPLALDVARSSSFADADAVVRDVVAAHGRIDVLVNNAGRTQVGALEETTEDELRNLFELHFFGPVALTRAVLPHFRRQGSGAVVQLSSVGGQVTMPGFGVYCATKFALEGLTETLVDELPGVRFVIVEPGAFRTGLFDSSAAVVSAAMPEYSGTVGPTREYVATGGGTQPGDPAKAAAAIHAVVTGERAPTRLVLGADAHGGIGTRLERLGAELAEWAEVSRSTDLDPVGTS